MKPGEETWANKGKAISAEVPDDLWHQGIVEVKDLLKLVVSTAEFDGRLLEQPDLEVQFKSVTRGITQMNTLNRLMQRVQTRDFNTEPEDDEAYADWTTSEVNVVTIRPLEAHQVAGAAEPPVQLGSGVKLLGHPALQAKARLTTAPEASRDLGNLALPALLRHDPAHSQAFQFSASRNGEPGLSVLELVDVADHTVVTPEAPLKLQVEAALGADEHLLPVGFDGEFFLPLGYATRQGAGTEITLEQLPAPTAKEGEKDLAGSIRIFFQKVIARPLGLPFPYPILAAAAVDEQGQVTYTADTAEVQAKVAAAQRIVLYIHGIIGDTRSMAGSARFLAGGTPPFFLADRYDLLLTFDYENLNTPIQQVARLLKQRLQEVGLGPQHGKTLHLVAHSMGGLVSRWFIEREGGNEMAQHLVMLGTPNAGSPWSTVEDWALTALSLGLNSLLPIAWPVTALGWLLGAIEKIDINLDQMGPGSEFLEELKNSPDPGIPYTILAGNTSLIKEARQPEAEGKSRLQRLLDRVPKQKLLHQGTALLFFNQPNDIAVSVDSIKSIPPGRLPRPKVREVDSDHISYFTTLAGLSALAESLDNQAA